jgi:serine/threonine protein kinase
MGILPAVRVNYRGRVAMAQIYGGRWKIGNSIGEGGQSRVFEATDLKGEHGDGTLALKYVKNANRDARFRQEISATALLTHPNIIKLIDHSALDASAEEPERLYLVMPLAKGQDLEKRRALYKGNLDSALIVASQLAAALKAAHDSGVIHRDVKPQNILFPAVETHDVWLSDFGICFMQGPDRPTAEGEAVGPRDFMAPELAYGGKLDVQPSADVYSLGKVIYYMISGGAIVPRETFPEPLYSEIFSVGGRYQLLKILLTRTVCVNNRFQTMDEVAAMLTNIQNADKAPSPLTPQSLTALENLEGKISRNRAIQIQNRATQERQREIESEVRTHVMQWLENQLQLTARSITERGLYTSEVKVVRSMPPIGLAWIPQDGVEMIWSDMNETSVWVHALQLYFCMKQPITTVVTVVGANANKPPDELKIEDRQFGILPIYQRRTKTAEYGARASASFWAFGVPGNLVALGQSVSPRPARTVRTQPPAEQQIIMQLLRFSQWPDKQAETKDQLLAICYERFIETVSRNLDSSWIV